MYEMNCKQIKWYAHGCVESECAYHVRNERKGR